MQYSNTKQSYFLKGFLLKTSSYLLLLVLFFNHPERGTAFQDNAATPDTLNQGNLQDEQLPPINQDDPPSQDEPPDEEPSVKFLRNVYTGWQQAGVGHDTDRLDSKIRANWVMVDEEGTFTGNVTLASLQEPPPPAPLILRDPNFRNPNVIQRRRPHPCSCFFPYAAPPVENIDPNFNPNSQPQNPDSFRPALPRAFMDIFLLNRGRLIATTSADENGDFQFDGVKQGNYSLVGYGKAGFFAFGLNVLGYNESGKSPTTINVTAMDNHDSFNAYWVNEFSPRVTFRIYGENRFDEKKTDPAKYYGLSGLSNFTPDAIAATTIERHLVNLTEDGRLLGRVHQTNSFDGRPVEAGNTEIFLVQENVIVARVGTDNYGVFELEGVPPGDYGLIAISNEGIAGFGIQVADNPNALSNELGTSEIFGGRIDAFNISTIRRNVQEESLPLDFNLVSSDTIGWLNQYMAEEAYNNAISAPRQSESDSERSQSGFGRPRGYQHPCDRFGCGSGCNCGGVGCATCTGGCVHETTCGDCGGCLDCGRGCKHGCGCGALRHKHRHK